MRELLNTISKGKKPIYPPVNKFIAPPVLEDDTKCKAMDGDDEPLWILMIIKSKIDNFDIRKAIRSTWGDEYQFAVLPMRRIFVLGIRTRDLQLQREIGIESSQYGDIVQYYFEDHYFNNTYKVMAGLKWARTNCRGPQYIMMVDDDFYVNTHKLRDFLDKPLGGVIAAYVNNNSIPIRQWSSKWYISLEEYPYRFWPAHPNGGFILMEYKTSYDLLTVLEYLKYLRFDDVLIGIAALKMNVQLKHNDKIIPDPIKYEDEKFFQALAVHGVKSAKVLTEIWKRQISYRRLK
ncbi:unnamed protein product [Dimorphilus gyrociliatus]|uniref:Hexosyltransferase n=1 Tax=Dimorphilus gyrociliatus TaxID=2664684 RepID=A0A7I8W3L0_9ANNE|nr:unnamed protein product [Dimorphilus gyrociliatus]